MSAKYLLPCPCGRQIVVEPRQAGQTIPCGCGALLQIPTLLDMNALEPAPPESVSEPLRSTWGFRHRLRLLGIVLVLTALVGGAWLYRERPISRFDAIDPAHIRQTAQKLPPSRTWEIWETMKQGLDRRTDQQYADDMEKFYLWQAFFVGIAVIGIALIAAGMVGMRGTGIRD